MQYLNWVGGSWTPAVSNKTLPWKASSLPASEFMDVVRALQHSHQSIDQVAKGEVGKSLEPRLRLLRRIQELLASHRVALAERISKAEGVPSWIVEERQLPRAIEAFATAAEWLEKPRSPDLSYHPVGVVGIMTSGYDAITEIAWRMASALAAGNAVILKASAYSPQTSHELLQVIQAALQDTGWPLGWVSLLHGGPDAGRALCEHPGISTLAVQARLEVASRIAQEASGKRLHLMSPGSNSMIVASEPSPEQMEKIYASMISFHDLPSFRATRVFVIDSIFKTFVAQIQKQIESKSLEIGDFLGEPDRVSYQNAIVQSRQEKGRPIASLDLPFGTVDMTLCSTLHQDEILGPFFAVSSFKYLHEAVQKMANVSPWGQVAYVWDQDEARGMRTAAKLDAGQVFLNGIPHTDPVGWAHLAWTPNKKSGLLPNGIEPLIEFFSRPVQISRMKG